MSQSDLFVEPPRPPARDTYTVSRLLREAKLLLEGSFPPLWIEGEISNLSRPASGHAYFSLKDNGAQVRCALFRGAMRGVSVNLKDGMQVLVRARISLYEQRGDFQLIVDHVEDAGEGALRRAFDQLKQRLAQEGLFEQARKRALPRLPRRIGLLTSPSGAVVHDILTTLRRRFPAIPVMIYPIPVQGEGAGAKIARMLQIAGQRNECDVLILARGGGSLEDLWAFNEEVVARALCACPIPVVSGVGHETDFTIADMAADARAPTPTAAAEMLSPHQEDWLEQYQRLEQHLVKCMRARLRSRAQHIDWLSARLVHPRMRIRAVQENLGALLLRLRLAQARTLTLARESAGEAIQRLHGCSPRIRLHAAQLRSQHLLTQLIMLARRQRERAEARVQRAAGALHTLSPLATLARGYAVVENADTGAVLIDAANVRTGERVRARLARGELECRVEKTRNEK
jgi:exodeoxyribonuclease VII large subunit